MNGVVRATLDTPFSVCRDGIAARAKADPGHPFQTEDFYTPQSSRTTELGESKASKESGQKCEQVMGWGRRAEHSRCLCFIVGSPPFYF